MSMQKWDTMRLRSRALIAVFFFISLLCSATLLCGQATSAQNQPSNSQSAQQPVQDLTPPSDAEAEKAAAPAPAPNQPSDTTNVGSAPAGQIQKGKDNSYLIRKDVEEVILYATVVDPRNRMITGLDRSSFSVYED